jgi:site-specific DNA-methyltransferase (adenine-specific)
MKVLHGDCVEVMHKMADESVHCVVTSPPYWGARDYACGDLEVGKEKTTGEYLVTLVNIFGHVKRVLRDDGTCWVNLGDRVHNGSMQCLPWAFADLMRTTGWFLKMGAPWIKRSPMPESATSRPSNGCEYFFMFTKKVSGYYYDADAVRLPVCDTTLARDKYTRITSGKDGPYAVAHDHETPSNPKGRNRRNTDWWIESLGYVAANNSYRGAHFAVMPEGLIEPAISAGCPQGGIVLDPFCGSGTTLAVAQKLGRDGIGIELNREYATLAEERVA